MKSEPPTPSSYFQFLVPESVMNLQLWFIISIPVIAPMLLHYLYIMGNRIYRSSYRRIWNTPTEISTTPFPPDNAPPIRKKSYTSTEVLKINTDFNGLDSELCGKTLEVASDAREFTQFVSQCQDLRYKDMQTTIEESHRHVDQLFQDIVHIRNQLIREWRKIREELQRIEDFSNGIEDFLTGDIIPRPFVEKLKQILAPTLQVSTCAPGPPPNTPAQSEPLQALDNTKYRPPHLRKEPYGTCSGNSHTKSECRKKSPIPIQRQRPYVTRTDSTTDFLDNENCQQLVSPQISDNSMTAPHQNSVPPTNSLLSFTATPSTSASLSSPTNSPVPAGNRIVRPRTPVDYQALHRGTQHSR